jgi:hypothetical protein
LKATGALPRSEHNHKPHAWPHYGRSARVMSESETPRASDCALDVS